MRRAKEALALHRVLGDEWGVAYDLLLLGVAHVREDDPSSGPLLEESVQLFQAFGDEYWTLRASVRLAWSCEMLGEHEQARALHADALQRARASGDEWMAARELGVLAMFALEEGQFDEAVLTMLEEAHRLLRDRPTHVDLFEDAKLLCRFARALAIEGHASEAVGLVACFEALFEEIGATVEPWLARINSETLAMIEGRLDEAAVAEARRQGRALTADEAVALASRELAP